MCIVIESNSLTLGPSAYCVIHDEGLDLYCGSKLFALDKPFYKVKYFSPVSDSPKKIYVKDNYYSLKDDKWNNLAEVLLLACSRVDDMSLFEKWKPCVQELGCKVDSINGVKLVIKFTRNRTKSCSQSRTD